MTEENASQLTHKIKKILKENAKLTNIRHKSDITI